MKRASTKAKRKPLAVVVEPVVRTLPARVLEDLNQHLITKGGRTGWADGALAAANLAGEMYNQSSSHPYDLADCILGKLNLLKKGKRIRRNPYSPNPAGQTRPAKGE